MKFSVLFSLAYFLSLSPIAHSEETEKWTHYECSLAKFTQLIDGGIFKEEEIGMLSSFTESNYPEKTEMYIRFTKMQVRLDGPILSDHTLKLNEESSEEITEEQGLLKNWGEKASHLIEELPDVPWKSADSTQEKEPDTKPRNTAYKKKTWSITPLERRPESNDRVITRSLSIDFDEKADIEAATPVRNNFYLRYTNTDQNNSKETSVGYKSVEYRYVYTCK